MASHIIKSYSFTKTGISTLGTDAKEDNWPVVYQIYNDASLYIGETTNLKSRMSQHIQGGDKAMLTKFSVIYDETFNKSVALDLESQLIQWFSGDGKYDMRNRNNGVADRDYFNRSNYQKEFTHIWEQLRDYGIADKSIQQIENSGLFKFSPYKRLNQSQLAVVNEVLIDLDESFTHGSGTLSIVGGTEGTGKTIVLMFLIKLIRDIQDFSANDTVELDDHNFDLYFKEPFNSRFKKKSMAFVIPNQSLRGSVSKIFKTIANMHTEVEVLSPLEFGNNSKMYDITFVDEAHLLKKTNQEVHKANRQKVTNINKTLFSDDLPHTELDWIVRKSKNVVMVYGDQRVRPNNITKDDIRGMHVREHLLTSQMRSSGGELYIDYLKNILSNSPPIEKQYFKEFDFKLFDDFSDFISSIRNKDAELGLSRVVAGFAWNWKSKKDSSLNDIIIDGIGLNWNSTMSDWVGSAKSITEVGSIYTIQGYDLNYCGVIIGNDLQYDPEQKKLVFSKKDYFDRGAKKRTKDQLESGAVLSDEELLAQVIRTYRILMNRSIKGTYVYVCDENLRKYLSRFISPAN